MVAAVLDLSALTLSGLCSTVELVSVDGAPRTDLRPRDSGRLIPSRSKTLCRRLVSVLVALTGGAGGVGK